MQVLKSKITSCVQKKLHWNPTACIWKNGKIVQSITENSIVICNKIVDTTKTIPTKSVLAKCTSTFY